MRSKDPFWEHVDVVENKRSRCKHCGEVFAPRNIHRIKLHLAGVARGIKKCTGVPAEVREEALKAVSKRKDETPSYSVVLQGKNSLPSNVQYSSPEISQKNDNVMLLRNNNDSKVINHKLAKFFLLNNIPFDVVETSSFIDFVKSVSRCDHGYKLPSHLELQTEFVSEIEMQVEKYVKDVKKSLEKTGCTIMVENCCNFINILVYSPEGAIFEASYEVSVLETMDFGIREIVASIIEKTGVDYVVQVITNDSQIFHSVGEMLEVNYPRIYLIRCVAQEIHFLLKDMFDEIPWIGQIIDHAELILKYMYHNDVVLSLMRQYTKDKELKHPSMSKFASKYQMLHSIFDNKNELQQLIASEEWYKLDSNRNEIAAKVTDIIQSENFWSEGRDVLDVLEPIVQVLRLVEDDKSTSGYLYEELKRAREAIEGYRDGNPAKYQRILELLEERQGMIIHPIHAAASFLNPTYMFLKDSEYWDINMYNGMNLLSEKLVASGEETANFTRELQLYRKRSKEFTNEMSYEIMNSYHPRKFTDWCSPLFLCYPINNLCK